jgi:type IV secretion system protein TrbI
MAEQIQQNSVLNKEVPEPAGVLPKNLKPLLYLGAAVLVIVAALFSGHGKRTAGQKGEGPNQPPQPMLEDGTENNVQDLEDQVAISQKRMAQPPASALPAADQARAGATGAQTYGSGGPSQCSSGRPCAGPIGTNPEQLSPAEQEAQQLAARDRALTFDAPFASNLVFARPQGESAKLEAPPENDGSGPLPAPLAGSPVAAREREASMAATPASIVARQPEVNLDAATGPPYVIYEGTILDTILLNRLDGDAAGPVRVLVSNPLYSHDRQHLLIPDGTIVLGESKKIGTAGFGQQRRMAVVFHRLIMPDGYSVDLDQFHGLDQIGEEGLKDRVDNHYLQIFGTSIALGVIAGAGEIEEGGGTISTSGSQAFATGASANVSQSAATIVDHFLAIPPTITIREGHRIKIYFTEDMLLPAYENHTIPQSY